MTLEEQEQWEAVMRYLESHGCAEIAKELRESMDRLLEVEKGWPSWGKTLLGRNEA